MSHSSPSSLSPFPMPPSRRGLTLLELLAALALTALLASTTLVMTGNLMRQAKEPDQTAPAWQRRLQRTLVHELTEAEQVRRIPDGMEIEGPLQPKPSVADGGHRPLKVTWRAQKGRLLREELDLVTGHYRRQTVLIGVDRLQLARSAGSGGTYQLSVAGPALPQGMTIRAPRGGDAHE